jgi:signal transduction histidine kinase
VAGHKVRARPPAGSQGGSGGVPLRAGTAAASGGPAFAASMFGAGGAALRRRGGCWRLRDWRLRTKITAVLLVPLVLAGVLGALRVSDLVRKADDSAALARQVGFAQQLGIVVYQLQGERYRVAAMQASGRATGSAEVQKQGERVDSAVTLLRAADVGSDSFPAAGGGQWHRVHRAALSRLGGLAAFRQATTPPNATVPESPLPAPNAVAGYSDLIAMLLDLDRQALGGAPDSLAHQADGIKALAIAQEQASLQHAVLQAGILTDRLTAEQQVTLRTADARFGAAAEEFGQAVSPAAQQLYFTARAVGDRKRLLDAALERAGRAVPLDTVPGDWNSAAAGTVEAIWQGQSTLLSDLRRDTALRGDLAMREAYWDGAVVVVLLLLAVGLLMVVVRSLLQPLRTLRTAAFDVADRRLPEAVEQLRSADGIPGDTTVDPVPVHSREEVGQVARAFDTVHVQAVRLAAEQAKLRCSLNDVFLRLSGRNQGLLERQQRLIDEVRNQAADPELVRRMSQLDGLATRMRRHSESLLLLAGGTVRRGAGAAAAVLDVLSAAVAETEDDQRVTVAPPPAAMVVGPVATDLIHLIAELLDNAVSATPRGAGVTLGGTLTEDKGLLVEITDAGTGLSPGELQAINAWLVSASAADVPAAGRAGLLVVRELAAQHGITVRLRRRLDGNGITATVLLPPTLVSVDLRVSAAHPEPEATPVSGPIVSALEGASHAPATAGWSGAQQQPPLQVSVIDDAIATDLFSPASVSPASLRVVTSPSGRPRTAQEEWLELFAPPESPSEPAFDPPEAGVAATDSLGIPAAEGLPEVREEIFEMVSAWFRERQSASTSQPEWRSPFDEGWQAAQALRSPVDHELTTAGLPKRQPRAQLVDDADGRVLPAPVPAVPARTPEDVRGRLSRYQRGLRVGRHARTGPEEPAEWTDTLPRLFDVEHGPFEEHQQ